MYYNYIIESVVYMMKDEKKIPLYCPTCKKLLAKLDKFGHCDKIFLYCRSCKQEYEITYKKSEELEP